MSADKICSALEAASAAGDVTVALYSEGDWVGLATGENPDMARCTSSTVAGEALCKTLLPELKSEWPQGLLWTIHDGCLQPRDAVSALETNGDWTGLRERPKAILHVAGKLESGASVDLRRTPNADAASSLVDAVLTIKTIAP